MIHTQPLPSLLGKDLESDYLLCLSISLVMLDLTISLRTPWTCVSPQSFSLTKLLPPTPYQLVLSTENFIKKLMFSLRTGNHVTHLVRPTSLSDRNIRLPERWFIVLFLVPYDSSVFHQKSNVSYNVLSHCPIYTNLSLLSPRLEMGLPIPHDNFLKFIHKPHIP